MKADSLSRTAGRLVTILLSPMLLAACLSDSESGASITDSGSGPGSNQPPTISGNPPSAITYGSVYSFTPSASDPDGDSLTFSITNRPVWASFDSSNGTLSGTPTLGNVGSFDAILISVSDGQASSSLREFSIRVEQNATGSVTLSWSAPTQNSDGSPLTDLAGYNIYFGTQTGSYTNKVTLNNSGVTSYVIENLAPSTYYFVATSWNNRGIESDYSNEVAKTVN